MTMAACGRKQLLANVGLRPEADVRLTTLACNVRGRFPSESIGGAAELDRAFIGAMMLS